MTSLVPPQYSEGPVDIWPYCRGGTKEDQLTLPRESITLEGGFEDWAPTLGPLGGSGGRGVWGYWGRKGTAACWALRLGSPVLHRSPPAEWRSATELSGPPPLCPHTVFKDIKTVSFSFKQWVSKLKTKHMEGCCDNLRIVTLFFIKKQCVLWKRNP